MILVADGDVPDPVVAALQAVNYDIRRYRELNLPARPDRELMAGILALGGILVTRDTGIPSQAYLLGYGLNGLTVVLLRWKESRPKDFQEMVAAVLKYGEDWKAIAARTPSMISVSRRGSRARAWGTIPSTMGRQKD
ncbi:MAG: hypothetical protein HY673_22790 [Chloroflexi bacterium]|nr:hypothetical protein [Chloroflexota bacterium]